MGRVTLQTIADRLGVSRMTVSNAFSRPNQLSAALRAQVLAVADELGYCGPDPAARTLSKGRSGTIGVLFTDTLSYAFTDRVATRFLAGLAGVVEAHGIGLTVLSTPRGGEVGAVARAVVDGLIVHSVDSDSPGLQEVRRRALPTILVDQAPEAGLLSVNVDDRGGGRAAARHVTGLGHRRVAVLVEALGGHPRTVDPVDQPPHHVVAERLAGWTDGLAATGVHPVVMNVPVNDRAQAVVAAGLLLDLDPRPTAFLCLSDLMARGVVDAATSRGLQVPRDLSVVGFDDAPEYALVPPALTTVRQPVDDKGRIAAELLLDLLDDVPSNHPDQTVLPVDLVVRDSTGPAPYRPRRST